MRKKNHCPFGGGGGGNHFQLFSARNARESHALYVAAATLPINLAHSRTLLLVYSSCYIRGLPYTTSKQKGVKNSQIWGFCGKRGMDEGVKNPIISWTSYTEDPSGGIGFGYGGKLCSYETYFAMQLARGADWRKWCQSASAVENAKSMKYQMPDQGRREGGRLGMENDCSR